jgi:hypothetical protein
VLGFIFTNKNKREPGTLISKPPYILNPKHNSMATLKKMLLRIIFALMTDEASTVKQKNGCRAPKQPRIASYSLGFFLGFD